jgi:GH43 family beta-xylosidase
MAGGAAGGSAGGTAGGAAGGSAGGAACTTRITYGSAWIHPSGHTADFDDVDGLVTWDGGFTLDTAGNSTAELSNGWRAVFTGREGAVIALQSSCSTAPCETRVTYGASWLPPPNHPAQYDDVSGVLTSDGACGSSFVTLSNGWQPHFNGACGYSIRYMQCGSSLFMNPVVATDCPDPGVTHDADAGFLMVCTSGGPGYPIRSSSDLVSWTLRGTAFDVTTKPAWATGDFWAPELHRVGAGWVLYFSARHTDGSLAIGAASASSPFGPFTAQSTPLVKESYPGAIDVHQFEDSGGGRWLSWKRDGNAVGAATPIRVQPLSSDGLSLTGSPTDVITNSLGWEGAVVEGPWVIFEGGFYYLFYSGNSYASTAYTIGVARSTSPAGPYTKAGAPILVSKGAWAGPGHGSVVRGPSGVWWHVFHAWTAGRINQAPGRQVLLERVTFENGWPAMHAAPSSRSQPAP